MWRLLVLTYHTNADHTRAVARGNFSPFGFQTVKFIAFPCLNLGAWYAPKLEMLGAYRKILGAKMHLNKHLKKPRLFVLCFFLQPTSAVKGSKGGSAAAKKSGKGKQVQGGGGRKKRQLLKFAIDCKNPVEDGIMNVKDFVSYASAGAFFML